MNDVDVWKAKVAKAALVEDFQATGMGKTIIQWLNAEVSRLTNILVDDDELDTNEVKRALIKGELKAYRLIGKQMNIAKLQGKQAKATLQANDIPEEEVDHRSPEEIAKNAGL